MKFKVYYKGFYIVEADNEDEAIEKGRGPSEIYRENSIGSIEEFSEESYRSLKLYMESIEEMGEFFEI